jgi:polysaccharide export outer membrane protein
MLWRVLRYTVLVFGVSIAFWSADMAAQEPQQPADSSTNQMGQEHRLPTAPEQAPANASSSSSGAPRLRIGPGDEADVTVYGLPELSQHIRVSSAGEISYPLIGTLKVAGLSSEEAQALIEKKLVDGNFLKNPHVTFYVKDYTSDGVTVLGEVAKPGTYSILTARRVFDSFLAAGGLTVRAGNTVTIAHKDNARQPQVLALTSDPAQSVQNNVELQPGDTVVVSRAGIVYVVGEVTRPGGFVMENRSIMSLTQVVAMAAGPTRLASLSHVRLLRRTPEGLKTSEIDYKKIILTKTPDIPLMAEDIVFVPPSRGKMAAGQGASSMLQMITSLAIYRF